MKNRLTNRFHMRYTRVNSIGWEQTWHRVSSNQVYRHHGYDYAVVSVFYRTPVFGELRLQPAYIW